MQLTVLGTASPYPGPGQAGPGYLVQSDGYNIVLDCGPGVIANIQKHIGIEELDAVIISHFHPDHCADLFSLGFALMMPVWAGEEARPIPLLLPPGGEGQFRQMADACGDLWEYYGQVFSVEEYSQGQALGFGPFHLNFYRMKHGMNCHGVKIAGEAAIGYSGDTAICDKLIEMANGLDLLVCEAGAPDTEVAAAANHMTARQAGEAAARAEVNKLVLTHFSPGTDRQQAMMEAQKEFSGEVVVACEGLTIHP